MATNVGVFQVARPTPRVSASPAEPRVMRCNAHHYAARLMRDGRKESVIIPPPHKIVVPARLIGGRPFYPRRCPFCGFELVKVPGRVYLEVTTKFNQGRV